MARRVVIKLHKARDFLEKNPRVPIAELMIQLGYNSLEYFKRSFLPLLVQFYGRCIEISNGYVYWKCRQEEEHGVVAVPA